ncbi:MAG: hypothetical protein ACPG49_02650 [Chitinophagales bacterium]
MKHFTIIIIAIVCIAFTSCQKENPNPIEKINNSEMLLKLSQSTKTNNKPVSAQKNLMLNFQTFLIRLNNNQ